MRTASAAFNRDLFWGFVILLDVLASALWHLNNWSTACPCHPIELSRDHGLIDAMKTCVMRGRRLFEIVTGGLERLTA